MILEDIDMHNCRKAENTQTLNQSDRGKGNVSIKQGGMDRAKQLGQMLMKSIEDKQLDQREVEIRNFFNKKPEILGKLVNVYHSVVHGSADEQIIGVNVSKIVPQVIQNIEAKPTQDTVDSFFGFLGKLLEDQKEDQDHASIVNDPNQNLASSPEKVKTLLSSLVEMGRGNLQVNQAGDLISNSFVGNVGMLKGIVDSIAGASNNVGPLWKYGTYLLIAAVSAVIVLLGVLVKDAKLKALGIISSIAGGIVVSIVLYIVDFCMHKVAKKRQAYTEIENLARTETQEAFERFKKVNEMERKMLEKEREISRNTPRTSDLIKAKNSSEETIDFIVVDNNKGDKKEGN